MQTLTAHPRTEEQVKALIALFKALDIPFEPIDDSKMSQEEYKAMLERSKAGESKILNADEQEEFFSL